MLYFIMGLNLLSYYHVYVAFCFFFFSFLQNISKEGPGSIAHSHVVT